MAQSAALLYLPAREPATMDSDSVRTAGPLLAESLDDLRLAEHVERALRASGYAALHGIRITVHAGFATLAGQVPSYYLKQVAQTAALAVPGIVRIQNGLEVVPAT